MSRCDYTENKPYAFISYAHADSEVVMPVIEAMKMHNINLWYDNGIEAGSEWPEYIAEKISSCNILIACISNAYIQSQNCKRELNFAIAEEKDLLSIHLEKANLSSGMRMQLGTYQAILKDNFKNNDSFCDEICNSKILKECILKSSDDFEDDIHIDFIRNITSTLSTMSPEELTNMWGGMKILDFCRGNIIGTIKYVNHNNMIISYEDGDRNIAFPSAFIDGYVTLYDDINNEPLPLFGEFLFK